MPDMKVVENRLRRMATRRGFRLLKSRTKDPRAVDYGLFCVIDLRTGKAVNQPIADRWIYSWTRDQVEAFLEGRPSPSNSP